MRNGSRPTAEPPDDHALERAFGDFVVDGEIVSMSERLAVSPARGRFYREQIVEGAAVEAGALIGTVAYNGGAPREVRSPVSGVLLGWLAWEGELLEKGAMLARIGPGPAANGNGTAASKNGSRKGNR
jgi:biotin carboxyl carrier protein